MTDKQLKIDWKHLATTPGYKSLKAAYIKDVEKSERYRHKHGCAPMRDKAEFLEHFNWVILYKMALLHIIKHH